MKKHLKSMMIAAGVILVFAVVLAGCATQSSSPTSAPTQPPAKPTTAVPTVAPTNTSVPEPGLSGNPVRGGLLYDEWWVVVGADEPSSDQPLWKTQSTNTRSGADTWRCKECHGWDYKGVDGAYGSGSHMTGFAGIFTAAQDKSAVELLAILKGSANADHDFSKVMDEQSLIDLALFMDQTLLDPATLLKSDNTSTGEAGPGLAKFAEICLFCHGPQGNAINFGNLDELEFIGHLAEDNPWEFIHKVRYGQPGTVMPSGILLNWSDQEIADLLAHAQTLTKEPMVSGGGQLYDEWWDVIGVEAPAGDQPLWASQTTNTRTGADTWRCKECHGWDYKGAEGAYGSGSHQTGFAGILSASSMASEDLTAWLNGQKNPDHDFSQYLDETAINALITFVQKEMKDVSTIVNADGSIIGGDPARGQRVFEGTCAKCHGADGKAMNFGNAEEPEFVGTIAVENPWEFIHKVSFGQPGTFMPSGIALGYTEETFRDLLAYARTLPVK